MHQILCPFQAGGGCTLQALSGYNSIHVMEGEKTPGCGEIWDEFALKRVQDQSWEAGAAGTGEQGASGHLPLAAGGAEHHRCAWENSGDADRLWLRRFCGRGYNQHSVQGNKPCFHVCQVSAVLNHPSLLRAVLQEPLQSLHTS